VAAAAPTTTKKDQDSTNSKSTSDESEPLMLRDQLAGWVEATGETLVPRVVAEVEAAWRQNAEGTERCLAKARDRAGVVTSRSGLLCRMLRDGDHLLGAPRRQAGRPRGGRELMPVAPLVACGECEGTGLVDVADGSGDQRRCPGCSGMGGVPATWRPWGVDE
jgi:hypothetical protein